KARSRRGVPGVGVGGLLRDDARPGGGGVGSVGLALAVAEQDDQDDERREQHGSEEEHDAPDPPDTSPEARLVLVVCATGDGSPSHAGTALSRAPRGGGRRRLAVARAGGGGAIARCRRDLTVAGCLAVGGRGGTVVRGGLTVRRWALPMGGCGRAIRGRSLPMVGGRLIVSLTRSRLAVALRGRGLARRGGGLPDLGLHSGGLEWGRRRGRLPLGRLLGTGLRRLCRLVWSLLSEV